MSELPAPTSSPPPSSPPVLACALLTCDAPPTLLLTLDPPRASADSPASSSPRSASSDSTPRPSDSTPRSSADAPAATSDDCPSECANSTPFDCIIIGGGPGGLTAATYLARYKRRFTLLDAQKSRALSIPRSHNVPGWPEGINGKELIMRMEEHACRYGADIRRGEVTHLRRCGDDLFSVDFNGGTLCAKTVILATGADDVRPQHKLVDWGVQRGLIRLSYCPVCDAYEVSGKRVAVLGDGMRGPCSALFLKRYTDDVTLLHFGERTVLTEHHREKLALEGVGLLECSLDDVVMEETRVIVGETWFDVLYIAMGIQPRVSLAVEAGAELDQDDGRVRVGLRQVTTVPNLYAIGDVAPGLNQIVTAQAQAAVAATGIHNYLRRLNGEPCWLEDV